MRRCVLGGPCAGGFVQENAAKSNVLLLAGVLGVVGGLVLLGIGLAPAKQLWDAVGPTFSGGPPPEDLAERMDAAMAKLKARVLVDVLGFVALMGGILAVHQALAKPKPKPVEQLVQEEVARRMAAFPAGAASPASVAQAAPVAAPAVSTPAAPPAATAPLRRTHCSCGSVLVAGGRICPLGHPQA